MRIIYSAGNRIGASSQLSRFLENSKNHEVKVAAYNISSYSVSVVDWLLDSIHLSSLFYKDGLFAARYNQNHIESILKDVAEFDPNLIICDSEHIFGHVANQIEVPLWYCSPLNILKGAKQFKKRSIYTYSFELYKKIKWPKATMNLIYSPFCDILNPPEIKEGYNWVRPYYKTPEKINIEENDRVERLNEFLKHVDLKDYYLTDGNTSNLSDLIYNDKKIIISPNVKNLEALINSDLVNKYKIGQNVGQIELMKEETVCEMEKVCDSGCEEISFSDNGNLQLHEYIERLII